MAKKPVHETEALLRELRRLYAAKGSTLTQIQVGAALGLKSGAAYVNRLFKKVERREPLPVFGPNNLAALRAYVASLKAPLISPPS